MIVDCINSCRGWFGIEPIYTVLFEHGVLIAPSTYYERHREPVRPAELEDAYLANALVTLHAENCGVSGARKLRRAAQRAGIDIGRDQVARLVRIAGITGAVRGRHRTTTTRRDPAATRHPDLVGRGWHVPTRTDELWVATSPTCGPGGFVSVAFVVDGFSGLLLGWRVSASKETGLVLDAFRQALDVRQR